MELDDDLCICFHVSKRKVINFLRVERPVRVGQLAECFGAGTGCGWCRPFLRQLFKEALANERVGQTLPGPQQYAVMRENFIRDQGGGQSDGCSEQSPGQ